jgi:hypothetical protein
MHRITPAQVLEFARDNHNRQFETLSTRAPFVVLHENGRVHYIPTSTGKRRRHSERALAGICELFSETNSFKNTDYKGISAHTSYTLTLVSHILESDAARLIQQIKSVLTPDLLKREYRSINEKNPMYGHCYAATEALYHLIKDSGQWSNYKPHRCKDDKGVTHWWLQDSENNILDPTKEQYFSVGRTPPYANGRKGPFLTQQPSGRAATIIARVRGKR